MPQHDRQSGSSRGDAAARRTDASRRTEHPRGLKSAARIVAHAGRTAFAAPSQSAYSRGLKSAAQGGVVSRGLKSAARGDASHNSNNGPWTRRFEDRRSGFSLIEVMIAIVILGLGLVMVGTIFPVAWERARKMSEYTVEQSVAPAAEDTLRSLMKVMEVCRVPDLNPPYNVPNCVSALGFAGDLLFNPTNAADIQDPDDRVHALHMQNIRVVDRGFVGEAPWEIERMPRLADILNKAESLQEPGSPFRNLCDEGLDSQCPPFNQNTFHAPQVRVHQRVHPPLNETRKNVQADGTFSGNDPLWDSALDTRRYAWSALHRLVGPISKDDYGRTRQFDIYYVTLRRPQPTNRYARQNPASVPDPYILATTPVTPAAQANPDSDLMFPVPWRVQVQILPESLSSSANPSNIPTEIEVPPPGVTDADARRMMVQMFPTGTQFVDEINGRVYRVARRRQVFDATQGEKVFLTLDREIFKEDLDLPENDPRCQSCIAMAGPNDSLDDEERLRTVWVYPPSAPERPPGKPQFPLFEGTSPVVQIDVRPLSITPSR